MKQAGIIYCKSTNKENIVDFNDVATKRKTPFISNIREIYYEKPR